MQGYFPKSDELMLWDPETIDEYEDWQRFARYLVAGKNSRSPNFRRPRMKRHFIVDGKRHPDE